MNRIFLSFLIIFLLPGIAAAGEMILTVGKADIIKLPRPASEILLSNPMVADVSLSKADRLYLIGKGIGSTNLFVFDDKGETIANLDIHVRIDEDAAGSTMKRLLPGENVKIETLNEDLILTGAASSPSAANKVRQIARRFVENDENIIDMMSVRGSQQVLLKVKVIEVDRSDLRELGIELDYGPKDIGNFTLNFATNSGLDFTAAPFGAGTLVKGSLTSLVSALERDGFAHILAEPNLTAVSGQSANFLAGGEFPIPVAQDDTGAITIEFKKFGVALAFTPTVLDEGRINLHMGTEVSSLTNEGQVNINGLTIPALAVRRAETTVEMGSGASLMIAGLLQTEMLSSASGLPGIEQTPIIGDLLGSDSFQRAESELVVLVTPILVEPFAEKVVEINKETVSGENSVLELGLFERLGRQYGPMDPKNYGPAGYIID